jgi:hypothetical protein
MRYPNRKSGSPLGHANYSRRLPVQEQTRVVTGRAAVDARLAAIGLTRAELLEAVRFGVAEAHRSTVNDPKTAAGYYRWSKTVRAIRDIKTTQGWLRREDDNYPMVVNPEGTIAISVATGDAVTGTEGNPDQPHPRTKNPKGAATRRAIVRNFAQTQFADIEPGFIRVPEPIEDEVLLETWILLICEEEDRDSNEVRSELSLPILMNGGHVAGWRERILLPATGPDGLRGVQDGRDDPEGPEIDVPVRRRGAAG